MIEIILNLCDFLRPILFFSLLGYVPMKFGIGFDVAAKAPSSADIRSTRDYQLRSAFKMEFANIVLAPFRLMAVAYFTAWLFVDKRPLMIVFLFILTVLPVYVAK